MNGQVQSSLVTSIGKMIDPMNKMCDKCVMCSLLLIVGVVIVLACTFATHEPVGCYPPSIIVHATIVSNGTTNTTIGRKMWM